MSNIGFVGSYGWARGICNVYNQLAKIIKTEHTIFLLQRGKNDWTEEFEKIEHVTKIDGYDIDKDFFEFWLKKNKIDVVIFNEEQWNGSYQKDCLVDVCKELNIKTLHYVVWERFDFKEFEYYMKFDKIICPTAACYDKLKNFGFENVEYMRWGADSEIFKKENIIREEKYTDKIVFFHPGGYGGMQDRKQTNEVIEAFSRLNNKNAYLIITRQDTQNFGNKFGMFKIPQLDNAEILVGTIEQNELIKLYNSADVIVLPSKWEGNGLPFYEALLLGKPVITLDAPPMNEIIKNNINGLLSKVEKFENYNGIFVDAAIVDINLLKTKMNICMTPMILDLLKKNAEKTGQELWDWNINGKKILEIIKELK